MVVNSYFGPRRRNRSHATPSYGPGKYKFGVDYYRQTYYSTEKLNHVRIKLVKAGQELMYSSKNFNSNYMKFFGYETCDKLLWTSGEDPLISYILLLP